MIRVARFAALVAFLLAPAAAWAQPSPSPYTSATRYDAVGRVTGTISADPDGVGTGNPFLAVRNSYDAAGRLIEVETGTLSAWKSDSVLPVNWGSDFTPLRTLETLYDTMGRKTRDTLREGAAGTIRTATDYSYDAAGRPDCTAVRMNAANFATPLAACTQGTGGADRITRSFYDVADQRLQLREGVGTADEGTEASWAYNLNGQVVTVIDGNGNRAQLVYDGFGRQNCWMFPSTTRATAFNDATQATALATSGALSGTITSGHCATGDFEAYTVDPNGNRTRLRKRDTRRIDFAYDNLNRVTQKTYPDGGATAVYYGYDLRNLQLYARHSSASGQGVTNSYDGFGRLLTQSSDMGGTARTLSYLYDRNGNRTRITHPDSVFFGYDYDGLNRPMWLRQNASPIAAGMVFNADGTLQGLGGNNGSATAFAYDGVQRLSTINHNFAGTAHDGSWTFGRNPASQISSLTRSNDSYAWTGHYAVQRAYATNGLNQYSAAGTATFTYDDNGNLETSPGPIANEVLTYTYDIENRLIGRTSTGTSPTVTLVWDPLGRLYQVTSPTTDTRFLYDGDALVTEYNAAGTILQRYAHNVGADVPLLWYEGANLSQPRWLHADERGSIIARTDAAASATVNAYDEYGIPASTNTGRFQYTGQIWLPEIGMYHYKARVYSPTLGRFLQTDPIGYDDQFNLYAYVGNDPINYSDPSGTCRDPCPDETRGNRPKWIPWKEWINARRRAVSQAWSQERENVRNNRPTSRNWSRAQRAELLQRGRIRGYIGHHRNTVNGNSLAMAGNPNNIEFLTPAEHNNLHREAGGTRVPIRGQSLINRGFGALGPITVITGVLSGRISLQSMEDDFIHDIGGHPQWEIDLGCDAIPGHPTCA